MSRVPPSPQQRAQATRQALLLAAGTHFAAHGYDRTTLTDLLTGGTITKGALYFHFPSKEALAEALVTAMTERWEEVGLAVEHDATDALDAVVRLTDAVVVRLDDPIVRGAARVLRDRVLAAPTLTDRTHQWEQQLSDLLIRAATDGLLQPRVDPAWVAEEIVASLAGRATLSDGAPPENDLWATMNDFWTGMLTLIATDAWIDRWNHSRWRQRPRPAPIGPAPIGPHQPRLP